jgi:hypothetical protein
MFKISRSVNMPKKKWAEITPDTGLRGEIFIEIPITDEMRKGICFYGVFYFIINAGSMPYE